MSLRTLLWLLLPFCFATPVLSEQPHVVMLTANHAFLLRNEQSPSGHDQWLNWDAEVFGGSYTNHYGNDLKAKVTFREADAIPNTLLAGISRQPFIAGGSLYKVAPLADGAVALMDGKVEGQGSEPVAWTFTRADGGKSFYTSLGHRDDFAGGVLPTLLKNAINWSLAK